MEAVLTSEATAVFLLHDTPASHPTEAKIRGFAHLTGGWHYGEGVPVESSVLNHAILLNQEAVRLGFFETDAFPGLNGEVMFTVYFHSDYVEFTLEPDGSVTLYHERDSEQVRYQESLSFREAKDSIKGLRKRAWKAFGSSAENTMIGENVDSRASHLGTRETPPEYLLSTQSVYVSPEGLFVNTSRDTTRELRMSRLFFGASQHAYCRPATG